MHCSRPSVRARTIPITHELGVLRGNLAEPPEFFLEILNDLERPSLSFRRSCTVIEAHERT